MGTCHLISPVLRSYAVNVVYGGLVKLREHAVVGHVAIRRHVRDVGWIKRVAGVATSARIERSKRTRGEWRLRRATARDDRARRERFGAARTAADPPASGRRAAVGEIRDDRIDLRFGDAIESGASVLFRPSRPP